MSAGGEHLKNEGTRKQVIIAGGIAGLISRFCIAPLDIVKIRLQLQTQYLDPLKLNLDGPLYTIRAILREEGLRGFWRGNVPAELLYVTYCAAQFTTYRSVSSILTPMPIPSTLTSFVSGATAGATATALTYPLDLLRTRFAAQGTRRVYKNILDGFAHIARNEGLGGYFHGLGAGVGQVVPYMGLFFAVYEGLRPEMQDLRLPFGSGDALAGTLASVIAKTGVFPLDLIRKRLQVQGPVRAMFADGRVPQYSHGVWQTGKTVVAREGWRGLYRGLGISLVKAAPASAITMWSYETALRMLMDGHISNAFP